VKLTTHLNLVPGLELVELYRHSQICFNGVYRDKFTCQIHKRTIFCVFFKFEFISYVSRHCERRVMSVIYIFDLSCIRSAILYINPFYQKSEYEGVRSYKKKI